MSTPAPGPAHTPAQGQEQPAWFQTFVAAIASVQGSQLSQFTQPTGMGLRHSAVLILFAEGPDGPDVLLIQRAAQMRSHAGQPAFPGGAVDPQDDGPVAAALREAQEETGLDPAGVQVAHVLPDLWLPPTGFVVTPVVGFWPSPVPVWAVDPAEVARAERVPVASLVDPGNRVTVVHPSGYRGPGFEVAGMLVWGFTAGLLDRLLDLAGWAQPWSVQREVGVSL
ncbi:MAG: CoA pyrophosphatase [Candidatus Nanopelagicales bacterium]